MNEYPDFCSRDWMTLTHDLELSILNKYQIPKMKVKALKKLQHTQDRHMHKCITTKLILFTRQTFIAIMAAKKLDW